MWGIAFTAMSSLAVVRPMLRCGCPIGAMQHPMSRAGSHMITEAAPEKPTPLLDTEQDGVICARGVCVIADETAPEACYIDEGGDMTCTSNSEAGPVDLLSWDYIWPRALLLVCSVLYGTNFPLGRMMNDALPASASSSARFLLAAGALSPFLLQLSPALRARAMLCGSFTALGYVSQSIALMDTPASTVALCATGVRTRELPRLAPEAFVAHCRLLDSGMSLWAPTRLAVSVRSQSSSAPRSP